MMLAMVLPQPGGPEAFQAVEKAIPTATADRSVLKIRAFGLNRAEIITRAGGSPDVQFPRVIGIEAVGTIYATDPDSGLKIGQKVVTLMGGLGRDFDGSYEEYALIPNQQLYPVKTDLGWAELAAVPESFYTAFGSLKKLQLQPGNQLLIRGGTSTVGIAGLLLAKAQGIRVTSTTRNPEKIAALSALGADQVLLDQGTLTKQQSYDGILELVGAETLIDSFKYANDQTTTVVTGGLGGSWDLTNFSPFEIVGRLTNFQSTIVNPNDLRAMLRLVTTHELKMPILREFQLTEISEAHQSMERPQTAIGKIIVIV